MFVLIVLIHFTDKFHARIRTGDIYVPKDLYGKKGKQPKYHAETGDENTPNPCTLSHCARFFSGTDPLRTSPETKVKSNEESFLHPYHFLHYPAHRVDRRRGSWPDRDCRDSACRSTRNASRR